MIESGPRERLAGAMADSQRQLPRKAVSEGFLDAAEMLIDRAGRQRCARPHSLDPAGDEDPWRQRLLPLHEPATGNSGSPLGLDVIANPFAGELRVAERELALDGGDSRIAIGG